MKSKLIKLRKGKKTIDWDSEISKELAHIEIISPSLEDIPNRFNELENLHSLTLHCPELKELPSTILGLQNLQILKIKNSADIDLNLEADGNLESLRILQLANLKLETLPEWIANSLKLDTIDIHGNKLIDLPPYFGNFTSLKRLNIDSNSFTTLPWELESLNSLNHISLDGNQFSEEEKLRINRVFKISF